LYQTRTVMIDTVPAATTDFDIPGIPPTNNVRIVIQTQHLADIKFTAIPAGSSKFRRIQQDKIYTINIEDYDNIPQSFRDNVPHTVMDENTLLSGDVARFAAVKFSLDISLDAILIAGNHVRKAGWRVHMANATLFATKDAIVTDEHCAELKALLVDFKVHEVCTVKAFEEPKKKTWQNTGATPKSLLCVLKCHQAPSLNESTLRAILTHLKATLIRADSTSALIRIDATSARYVGSSLCGRQYLLDHINPEERAPTHVDGS
jgi:hypothetical protein